MGTLRSQTGKAIHHVGVTMAFIWADLEGLKFIIYICVFLRSVPQTQSANEWELELDTGVVF